MGIIAMSRIDFEVEQSSKKLQGVEVEHLTHSGFNWKL
jgi:hypothetical protein